MIVREVVYMIYDELKTQSDDSFITEDHVMFLMDKYRSFLLKQRYADIKKSIPYSNYQTVCIDLEKYSPLDGIACAGDSYLRSVKTVPDVMNLAITKITPTDFFANEITYVNRERFRYTGYNRYLKDTIYATITPDNYLYLKSRNVQFLHLEKVKVVSVFSGYEKAFELRCDEGEENCDILDSNFPLESALVPPLIQLVVQELLGAVYRPKDDTNNAKDDLSGLSLSQPQSVRRSSRDEGND